MTPLLMLHGATGSAEQFSILANQLKSTYRVYTMDFYGHGTKTHIHDPYSIEGFAKQVNHFIGEMKLDSLDIFGYSMGGYVALYLSRHLDFKGKIITLGTKFAWNEDVAAKETKYLQPQLIIEKVPAFAQQLAAAHGEDHWKTVVENTASMLTAMGKDNPLKPEDFAQISSTCMIMLGDRDKMVTFEETVDVYRRLPHAKLAVLPGMTHPIEQADAAMVAYHVTRFL